MAKKKKTLKKKRRLPPSLSAEEQARLDALLQDLEALHGLDLKEEIPSPQFAQALVEELPLHAPETPRLLVALNEAFHDKNVQKAVKKAASGTSTALDPFSVIFIIVPQSSEPVL